MKYNINLDQRALYELTPKITLVEAVILDYLIMLCRELNTKIEEQRIDGFTWVDYKHLLDDMPLLKGRTPATLTPKIKKLEKLGYIETITQNSRKYVKLTELCDNLFRKLNAPIKKTKCTHLENLIDNNTNNNIDNNNKEKNNFLKVKEVITSNNGWEELKAKFPYRDYEFQMKKMVGWWNEADRTLKRPFSAFANWIEKTKPDSGLIEQRTLEEKQKRLEEEMKKADKMKAPPKEATRKMAEIRQSLSKKLSFK